MFPTPSHHDVLVFLVQITALLFAAKTLGEIAQRVGQPPVVGELLAGIVLGPSLIVTLFPRAHTWLIPTTDVQGGLLQTISLIGAIFLLLTTGLQTNLLILRQQAKIAAGVALGGLLLPFVSGLLLGLLLPDPLLGPITGRFVFALFLATAMAISSIAVISKVLIDLNLLRGEIGQTIVAAAMVDDTVGWMLLSVIASLARGEGLSVGRLLWAIGNVLGFLLISFVMGRWIVKPLLALVANKLTAPESVLAFVMLLTLAWAALSQALELEAVLGAFVMGVVFGQLPQLPHEVHDKLRSIGLGIFVPIFFATAGLKVNVVGLFDFTLLAVALVVIGVAIASKVIGVYLGARLLGHRTHWIALSFGVGLTARGGLEILVATLGLSLGILSQAMFAIIILIPVTTSLITPTLLRWALGHVQRSATGQIGLSEVEALQGLKHRQG